MLNPPLITLAFTSGLAIAGAAAMGVPILIHLLSRFRRKREPWGAMRFLLEAFQKHRRRLQLEQLLLLLVRCLLLLTLGLALAGPVLSGCAGRMAGGLDASGRRVYLVLDDALSSRATSGGEATRFDTLKQTAVTLLEALGPADRVALVRAATPVKSDLLPPSLDLAAARQTLDAMQPRFTATDLVGALSAVDASIRRENDPADRVFVVVLSDLSRATLTEQTLAAGVPTLLRGLDERAQVVLSPPVVGSANVQIASATPRRTMLLLTPGTPGAAPMEVQLRRFDTEALPAVTPVELTMVDSEGKAVGDAVRRDVRWSTGQTSATLNVELPITWSGTDDANQPATAAILVRLAGDVAGDALADDDTRYAVVELRRRLTLGVVGDTATSSTATGGGFNPRQWLGLALSPMERGTVMELIDVAPESLGGPQPQATPLDAALITRPDRVTPEGWSALRRLAEDGGLVWVFAPATDTASVWGQAMIAAFELGWQIGLEPIAPPVQRRSISSSVAGEQAEPWSLDVNSPTPEPLGLLASDWADLMRPVRVNKRLELTLREGQDKVWLALPQGPWLGAADVGEGKLLLLASALDPQWTNLPTKPLFVPLLHETLRSVLGGTVESSRRRAVTAGTTPGLGRRWAGAEELVRIGGPESLRLTGAGDRGVAVNLSGPVELPGLWRASPEAAGRVLAVNVDADAGDTRAMEPQRLTEWLAGLGRWTYLNPNEPSASLQVQREATDIGWALLWAVLGLALLETLLARRFSHADQGQGTGLGAGPTALLRRALATMQQERTESNSKAA